MNDNNDLGLPSNIMEASSMVEPLNNISVDIPALPMKIDGLSPNTVMEAPPTEEPFVPVFSSIVSDGLSLNTMETPPMEEKLVPVSTILSALVSSSNPEEAPEFVSSPSLKRGRPDETTSDFCESTESKLKAMKASPGGQLNAASAPLRSIVHSVLDGWPDQMEPIDTSLSKLLGLLCETGEGENLGDHGELHVMAAGNNALSPAYSSTAVVVCETRAPPRKKKSVRWGVTTISAPSQRIGRESLQPSEDLNERLSSILSLSASLRSKMVENGGGSYELLAKHVDFVISRVEADLGCPVQKKESHCTSEVKGFGNVDENRASAFLSSELRALMAPENCGLSSKVLKRKSEVLSSLLRFEMKELLNHGTSAIAIKAFTGNICHNYEDPAALFHHALQHLSFLSSGDSCGRLLGPIHVSLDSEVCSMTNIDQVDGKEKNIFSLSQISSLGILLVDSMTRCKGGWAFSRPVVEMWPDIADDYLKHVSEPMDLGTIKERLAAMSYSSVSACIHDIRLCFSNAREYDGNHAEVAVVVSALERALEVELVKLLCQNQSPQSLASEDEAYSTKLGCRIVEMLSCIEAHEFCRKVLCVPAVDTAVHAGRWARLEQLSREAAEHQVIELN